jgi:hypothetical protein
VFLMTGMLVLDWLVIRTIPSLRRTFAECLSRRQWLCRFVL